MITLDQHPLLKQWYRLMRKTDTLNRIGADWKKREKVWPHYGLARIQWEGPWTAPGVPMVARYRHTHWVGAQRLGSAEDIWIFDINAICVGGWIPLDEWSDQLVPWLLKECNSKANGKWHITHGVEVGRCADIQRSLNDA